MSICGHACSCLCWHCMFLFFKSTNGATSPVFHSLQSGDDKDHQLLLHLNLLLCTDQRCLAFSVSQCHTVLWHLALWYCVCNLFHFMLFCCLAMHSKSYWCHWSPSYPRSGGETVCAPSAHQIPAGPLWSTGGEFREQPLVVPTQQPSFTEGLIKPDNIPSAWASLFSRLIAKWQLKASPRCRYKCLWGA